MTDELVWCGIRVTVEIIDDPVLAAELERILHG